MALKVRTMHIAAGAAAYVAPDGGAFAQVDPFSQQAFYSHDCVTFYELTIVERKGFFLDTTISFTNTWTGESGQFHICDQVLEFEGRSYPKDRGIRTVQAIYLPGDRVPEYVFRMVSGKIIYVSRGANYSYVSFRLFTGDLPHLTEISVVDTYRLRDCGTTFVVTEEGTLSVPYQGQPTWENERLFILDLDEYTVIETEEGVIIT